MDIYLKIEQSFTSDQTELENFFFLKKKISLLNQVHKKLISFSLVQLRGERKKENKEMKDIYLGNFYSHNHFKYKYHPLYIYNM